MKTAKALKVTFWWLGLVILIVDLLIGVPLAIALEPASISFTFMIVIALILLIAVVMLLGGAVLSVLISIERHVDNQRL